MPRSTKVRRRSAAQKRQDLAAAGDCVSETSGAEVIAPIKARDVQSGNYCRFARLAAPTPRGVDRSVVQQTLDVGDANVAATLQVLSRESNIAISLVEF